MSEPFDAWRAMRDAASRLRDEPELIQALTVFVDYWGLDSYTPPLAVESNVRDLVLAFTYAAKTPAPDAVPVVASPQETTAVDDSERPFVSDNDNAPAVCPECGGDGGFDAERPRQVAVKCRYCNGTGEVPSEPADTEDDLLRRAGDFLSAVIENCDVSDGVCCCGEEMARHSEPMACGHTPTDHGSYQASRAVEGWKAALATPPAPVRAPLEGCHDE